MPHVRPRAAQGRELRLRRVEDFVVQLGGAVQVALRDHAPGDALIICVHHRARALRIARPAEQREHGLPGFRGHLLVALVQRLQQLRPRFRHATLVEGVHAEAHLQLALPLRLGRIRQQHSHRLRHLRDGQARVACAAREQRGVL